ncbi:MULTISPECIES: hypothetical protein [Bacillota]|uniref:hypothetical protein n=1 Tax=Bacillota TaxID=1239 RepID=UPI0039F0BD81
MRSFSKLELLKDKFRAESKTFWQIIKEPHYRYLELEIPYYDYLRGNVLISDMKAVMDDCPKNIDLGTLINLLYLQLLYQVRKGITTVNNKKQGLDLQTLGYKLASIKDGTIFPKMVEKIRIEEFNQLTPTTWVLEEREEEVEHQKKNRPQNAYLTIKMKTEDVYRGEVLLNDLYNINEEIDFNVEELMTMLYVDFIKKIKDEGNDEKVMKSIIAAFEYFG